MNEFTVLDQQNFLITVDQVPPEMGIGDVYESPNGTMFQVLYIDRSANEVGIIPVVIDERKTS